MDDVISGKRYSRGLLGPEVKLAFGSVFTSNGTQRPLLNNSCYVLGDCYTTNCAAALAVPDVRKLDMQVGPALAGIAGN